MQGFVGGHGEQTFSIEQAWTSGNSSVHVTHGHVSEGKVAWLDVTPSVNKPCRNRNCLSTCHLENLQSSFESFSANSDGEDLEEEVREV